VIDITVKYSVMYFSIGQVGKYDARARFPKEWRDEIAAKELAFEDFMAAQGRASAHVISGL
jgi:hypothetical protein